MESAGYGVIALSAVIAVSVMIVYIAGMIHKKETDRHSMRPHQI